MTPFINLYQGNCLDVLRRLPRRSVQMVVTSPPYWGLRDYQTGSWEGGDADCDHATAKIKGRADYGFSDACKKQATQPHAGYSEYKKKCPKCGAIRVDDQLGLEKTPEEFVAKLVAIFRRVKRVLRDDGTVWLNLGDSYSQGGRGPGSKSYQKRIGKKTGDARGLNGKSPPQGLKAKELVGIPWRVAFALQADGWYLRSDIIWHKPNSMPESVTDRPSKSHEYVFLLTKQERYFYDHVAIMEEGDPKTQTRIMKERSRGLVNRLTGNNKHVDAFHHKGVLAHQHGARNSGRNQRSVWSIPTHPYKEAHFAVFPPALVTLPIKAGTSEHGACPTCGTPWKRVVKKDRQATRPGLNTKVRDRTGIEIGNRDPERHVTETQTIGWRPTCDCCGFAPWPTMPKKPPDDASESETDNYDKECERVQKKRDRLLDKYKELETVPCVVLDPFVGSGTSGYVAVKYDCSFIGIDLSEEYLKLAKKRIKKVSGQGTLFRDAIPIEVVR